MKVCKIQSSIPVCNNKVPLLTLVRVSLTQVPSISFSLPRLLQWPLGCGGWYSKLVVFRMSASDFASSIER